MLSVTFCWPGISGYMAACWRALNTQLEGKVSVLSVHSRKFPLDIMTGMDFRMLSEAQREDAEFVQQWVCERNPSVVVVGGWGVPAFTALARSEALRGTPFVIGFDNPWTGTLRQRIAPIRLRRYMRRFAAVVVPGEWARQFARRLVARDVPVETGLYGIAAEAFNQAACQRRLRNDWPKSFLYMGRYEPVKGLDALVEAYRTYRQKRSDPWPLAACGRGSLTARLKDVDGLTNYGFVAPADQPQLLEKHGVLVVPSAYEPWGVVIAEACSAGMPILCTEACGAAVELVRGGFNGIVVPTGCAESLANGLGWLHDHYSRLPEMGRRSESLALPFAASAWAEHWRDLLQRVAEKE
jgi:glycosyltransferase involved in cell wall biosynthesis